MTKVGWRGYPKFETKINIEERAYMQIMTSPPKNIKYNFLFFACFLSAQQQLSFRQHSGGEDLSSTGLSPRAQTKPLH